MKRRSRSNDSSLELLLDTICNTFGGILFLAILVIVLLQGTSKSQATTDASQSISPTELVELAEEHANLESQLADLREVLKNQSLLAARFVQAEKARFLAELRELRADYEATLKERNALLGEIAARQARIQELEEQLAELDVELAESKAEVKATEKALQSEIASRSKNAVLPRVRSTFKREVGLIVRYGRAYQWHRYDQRGERLGLNTDEFVVLKEENGRLITKPKPYAGVDLRDAASASGIARKLGSFEPTRHYLCLSVWPDSFEQFQNLKGELVKLGFEYRLMPMSDGATLADRGGTGGQVQ